MIWVAFAWLAALTVSHIYSKKWVEPGRRVVERVGADIQMWPQPPRAEFVQSNRVEEIIKGTKGNVSIDDVLV